MKKKKPGNDYDDFGSVKKPTKRAVSPMLERRESPGMGKRGGGKKGYVLDDVELIIQLTIHS